MQALLVSAIWSNIFFSEQKKTTKIILSVTETLRKINCIFHISNTTTKEIDRTRTALQKKKKITAFFALGGRYFHVLYYNFIRSVVSLGFLNRT